uniref:Uncharacterized protein n=1 Tax=Bacillus thuringiensis serovar chinensis CT-43 TaxID=541229 RepID=E7CGH5_BACTU|nr:hypothetical protein pBMB0558_00240 [Bacillus thuringiensis serovar chinensis CT-43]
MKTDKYIATIKGISEMGIARMNLSDIENVEQAYLEKENNYRNQSLNKNQTLLNHHTERKILFLSGLKNKNLKMKKYKLIKSCIKTVRAYK